MSDAELQRHCANVADDIYADYRGSRDAGTIGVMCVQDGNDPSTRRLVVTSQAGEGTPPPRVRPTLAEHGAEWRNAPPNLTNQRPALNDQGQPIKVRNPETGRMNQVYETSDSGNGHYYERTQGPNGPEYRPYTKRSEANPGGESRHHAEQRGLSSLRPGEQVAAIGPSRPCCAGCRAALQNQGHMDKVPPHRRGG